MKIKLKNRSNHMKLYILLHQFYCKNQGSCECLEVKVSDALIPSSLSLLPGETSRWLPEEILEIPEINRDIRKRHLQFRRQRSPATKQPLKTKKRRRKKATSKNNEERNP